MSWLNYIIHSTIISYIGYFILFYPLIMGVVWTTFGSLFWLKYERKALPQKEPITWPSVAILVPCHNEEATIEKTCDALVSIDYPSYSVYFINDASTDRTFETLKMWVERYSNFTLISLKENQGKADALNSALTMVTTIDITVVMDADTIINPATLKELVTPMVNPPYFHAVTCNPIVYNRSHTLGKIQALEFTSIIGLIKRAQHILGKLFSVSGCLTAFRTKALLNIQGFSNQTATEDIDITWRLQENNYYVGFAPKAIAHIQAPATIKEIWKQRCRWALGGWHLLRQHSHIFSKWRWRHLWVIYLNFLISYLWAMLFTFYLFIELITLPFVFISHPFITLGDIIALGSVLTIISLLQFIVSIKINLQYDHSIWKTFFWVPWYPLFFFVIGALSVFHKSIKGLFMTSNYAGKWKSPMRTEVLAYKREKG